MKNQAITSAETSLNQVPAAFKKIEWEPGQFNFDYGGGKYDKATEWLLEEKQVVNCVYDPFNRSEEHNEKVLTQAGYFESFTCCNVLNVIAEDLARDNVIRDLWYLSKYGEKPVFISVYEGDRTGKGRKTTKGWQNHRPLKSYLAEVQEYFPEAFISKGLIITREVN